MTDILDDIQSTLFNRALARREDASAQISSLDDFHSFFGKGGPGGFAWCYAADNAAYEDVLAPYKVTPRCILWTIMTNWVSASLPVSPDSERLSSPSHTDGEKRFRLRRANVALKARRGWGL